MTIDLAFGRGVTFAGGVGIAPRGAQRLACGGFGGRSGLQFGLGRLQGVALGGGIETGLLELAFNLNQARPLGEASRRAGRCVRGGDKPVPAPDVTFQRHQTLARL